jgi:hypothetical protein
MSVTQTPTLLPGLTHGQRQQVAEALSRVGTVPIGLLALVFMDVDRYAAQCFSARYAVRAGLRGEREPMPRADVVTAIVSEEHHVSSGAVAFAYGLACGLRLGRRFWPHTTINTRRHVSLDWQRLDKNQRERVTRFMQALLAGLEPRHVPGPRPGTKTTKKAIADDFTALERWKVAIRDRKRAEARRW